MKNTPSHHTNYSRYFSLKQKAFLINMSEDRNREHFESLSGVIVNRYQDIIELQIPYLTGQEISETDTEKTTYKLTTETLGSGLQMMAELIKITSGNIFHLQLCGSMELYQRRKTSRVDTTLKLFHARQNYPLSQYRKEFKRIMDYMKSQGLPPNLNLREVAVNLSIGGIRLAIEPQEQPSPLSMFFLDVDDKIPPVCAVAESAWQRQEDSVLMCGHRFIHILKADQERINQHVQSVQKKLGLAVEASKTNWELIDRMTYEGQQSKP